MIVSSKVISNLFGENINPSFDLVFFGSYQISMNVLRNPTHVIKTLTAPTARVLSSVFVNQDSQEMDQHVPVCLRYV